jgi:two-component system CheB/CheR fusion protein
MAYVLIQHMDPAHESLLPQLLSKSSPMPIHQVQDGMPVQPNNIYVIPPNANMALVEGRLKLVPRGESPEVHMTFDYFLRSLAEARGNRAIGVVLSGTGSDGSLGVTAVKAAGGIIFAQDDQTARFNGMPRSAVSTGCVDFILPPDEIARELSLIGCHPYVAHSPLPVEQAYIELQDDKALQRIFAALRTAKGVDFSYYKPATFQRRLARRLAVHHLNGLGEYLEYLHKHPGELEALYKDVLINVTSFFRYPEAFEVLENKVFPALLQDRPSGTPIRIWVPGCSTGEEAYSIGMVLLDFLGTRKMAFPIQIFATDVSEDIITKARTGQFLENIAADVSPDRLKRYFEKFGGGYKISKSVRDLCTFSKHNLMIDPPFSKLDLISCRNVIIYWEMVLQKKIFPLFHYALGPRGFLMLGSAESIHSFTPLFEPVDKDHQIYLKKPATGHPEFHFVGTPAVKPVDVSPRPVREPASVFDPQLEADHIARKHFSPPSLLVNEDLEIVQFRGEISPYISPMTGKASLQLMQLVPRDLAKDISALIDQAREKDAVVQKADRQVGIHDQLKRVTIHVFPIRNEPSKERFFLIFFEEKMRLSVASAQSKLKDRRPVHAVSKGSAAEIAQLKEKLSEMETHLQATVEKSEALNEELRSVNEEILSANEELQAGNEELETTKEELQSTNEELTTTNSELRSSILEANQARNRSRMIVETIRQPLLVLDDHYRILEANQAFYDTFKVSEEETRNQLLYDLGNGQWRIPELRTLLESQLPRLQIVTNFEVEHEFPNVGPKTMILNARQIMRGGGDPERILLSIEDVTERRKAEKVLEKSHRELQSETVKLGERVGEKTRELAQSQEALQQARQLEAIGRLAGGVAHDFNNLMTGIMGMAEDLQKQSEGNGSRNENLNEIIQAAQKACALTKQLLAFGRRQVFDQRVLNLNQVISEMKPLWPRLIGENIEFKFTLDPQLANVRADQTQLEQVILNLVMNARDALPRGGRVIIETANIDLAADNLPPNVDLKPGTYVRLTLSDNGSGMDPETLGRVFEPFFTTKEKGKGTGLGLATSYGIIKQHGGEVSVESYPGKGTIFQIYLPRVEEKLEAEPAASGKGAVTGGTEKILVVEDEDIVRRVVTRALRRSGYTILEARNGQEAIELVKASAQRIQLLLTDLIMPGLDGRELAKQLRADHPEIKILYMSGYPEDVITRGGTPEPGMAFIEKSFNSEMLCRKVREVLDQPKAK